jgi:hypothetical protein
MEEPLKYFQVEKVGDKGRKREKTLIIAERPVTLYLNEREIVTLLATGSYSRKAGFKKISLLRKWK